MDGKPNQNETYKSFNYYIHYSRLCELSDTRVVIDNGNPNF